MRKTRRRSGGRKRRTRCWRRRTKSGRRYTVCKGSRGQKGVYKRKHRRTSYAKKRLRHRGGDGEGTETQLNRIESKLDESMKLTEEGDRDLLLELQVRLNHLGEQLEQRGGYSGIKVPLTPANFQKPSQPVLPPYGPVNVPVPGITKVHDGEYYYSKNNRVIANPKATSCKWGKPKKGGRKRKRRGGKRRRRQRGGSASSVVNVLPGGTDIRDVYWGTGNNLVNLWDNWNGFAGRMSPAPATQPIGTSKSVQVIPASLPQMYESAGEAAAVKPYTAYD